MKMRDEGEYEAIFKNASYREYTMKLMVKKEEYTSAASQGEESRVRCSIFNCQPVNYAREGWDMLRELGVVE